MTRWRGAEPTLPPAELLDAGHAGHAVHAVHAVRGATVEDRSEG